MDQTILSKQNNYPGSYIKQDLKEAEEEHKAHKELQDKKYGLYFLLFQGLVYLIAIISFGFGNPDQLGKPYDINLNVCGVGIGLEQYKFIYFTNPTDSKHLVRTVCVKECPVLAVENDEDESLELECYLNKLINSCRNRPSIDDPTYTMLYYDSVQFIDVCLPKKASYFNNIQEGLEQSGIISFLSDISNGKIIIFATLALCLLLNQLFYFLMVKLQESVIWVISITSIFGLFLSGILGLFYYMKQSGYSEPLSSGVVMLTDEQAIGRIQVEESNITIILLSSLFFLLFGVYFLIDLIFNRKTYKTLGIKIQIVNYFFDFSTSEIQQQEGQPSRFREILILLMGSAGCLLVFCTLWVWMATNLFSIGKAEEGYYAFNTFQLSWTTFIMGFIHIFELIVVTLAILGSEYMLLIGKVVEVYKHMGIKRQKINSQDRELSLMDIFEIYAFNNFGSVVFGEILIFGLMIPRLFIRIYVWIRQKKNPQFVISDRLQQILCINERSYLLAYLRNDEFLMSAQSQYVFDQKLKETTQVQYHGEQLSVTYCFAVANLCVSLTYILIITTSTSIGIHQPVYFLMVSFIFSYFISAMFSTIYGATIDNLTILLYRDTTADGKIVGTCVKNVVRLMKESDLSEQNPQQLQNNNNGQE
ncbi:unnamed protein product [Paramecium sonneborni]|uniref:Choline transporter-like protein n=1 Tax=Paramecium sonneborni TaxID=65129 RepID=A0A8S1PN40_9CILI|nr:unnamed protein product [Paramecium sonneborni]